ncbi:O-antigen ligase family protein [Arthrobacter sp. D3-18]
MTIQVALLCCLALLSLAYITARKGESTRLPKLEMAWFHCTVTWPVVVKAALGSFIFSGDADSGTSYLLVTYGPALFMSVALLAFRVRGDAKLFSPGVWVFASVALSVPFIVFSGTSGVAGVLPTLLILPALFQRASPIPLEAWFRSARTSLLLVVMAIAGTALVAPINIIGLCRLDKCSAFGEVLTSPITNNGNFAGVAIALLLPLALLGLRKFPMILTAAAGLIMIEASGSRSAAISAWIVSAVVLLASKNWQSRAWIPIFAFAGVLVASVVTAVGTFPREFATYRGGLWSRAQELFSQQPIIGNGPGFWSAQPPEMSFLANYSPHNFWLEFAVSGGMVAVICVFAAGVALLRRVEKQERYALLMMFIAILALGVVEAPVQTAKFGLAPFAHLLPLIIGASCAVATRSQETRSQLQPAPLGKNLVRH